MIELPDHERVQAALLRVQGLSADEINRAIESRIGDPMMAAFVHAARSLAGSGETLDDKALAKRVQLMVYSYLLCTEVFADAFAAADQAGAK